MEVKSARTKRNKQGRITEGKGGYSHIGTQWTVNMMTQDTIKCVALGTTAGNGQRSLPQGLELRPFVG